MYLAMLRRKAVEELTLRRIMSTSTMVSALYANTNLDSKDNKGVREKMIEELNQATEEQFVSTVARIYGAPDPNAVDEVDLNDPWWAAMQVPEHIRAEAAGATPEEIAALKAKEEENK